MGKKAAATPVAALYFITDEHGAALVAGTAQTLHELGGSQADAAHSLDTFHNDRRNVSLFEFRLKG